MFEIDVSVEVDNGRTHKHEFSNHVCVLQLPKVMTIAAAATTSTSLLPVLAEITFEFIDKFSVNYLAVSSNNWITHGTLSNLMGLTANLLYGFRTPSGKQFITAGNTEAVISDKCVHVHICCA